MLGARGAESAPSDGRPHGGRTFPIPNEMGPELDGLEAPSSPTSPALMEEPLAEGYSAPMNHAPSCLQGHLQPLCDRTSSNFLQGALSAMYWDVYVFSIAPPVRLSPFVPQPSFPELHTCSHTHWRTCLFVAASRKSEACPPCGWDHNHWMGIVAVQMAHPP